MSHTIFAPEYILEFLALKFIFLLLYFKYKIALFSLKILNEKLKIFVEGDFLKDF